MFSTIPSLISRSFPGGGGGYDPNAQAYINAVIAAGGTLSTPQQNAVNTLVLDLKSAGIWSLIDAAYPFTGGTSASCGLNLVNPVSSDAAYRMTFNGSWTINSNGVVPSSKSSSNFGNSFWIPSTRANNNHYYRYINQVNNVSCDYAGALSSNYYIMGACQQLEWFDGSWNLSLGGAVSGTAGFSQAISRIASNSASFWRKLTGGSWFRFAQTSQGEGSLPTVPMYIGAINGANFPEQMRYAFLSYGQGLTDTQITNLDSAVTTFNTSLGRNF